MSSKMTVCFLLSEKQMERLERLLPYWQQYVNDDGEKPFENMTLQELFQEIMSAGSYKIIDARLELEEWRQNRIKEKEPIL